MSRYWKTAEYSQLSAEELRYKAEESMRKAESKDRSMGPVAIGERTITVSWWGKAWCGNLEKHADFTSRLERGERHARTGTVIDLQIRAGRIQTRVQERRKAPYKVETHISPLKEEDCQRIMQACANQIGNLEALLSGEFPQSPQGPFTGESGLFPSPREISFQCSCPDWATMCKHVVAVLYGIGNRPDENPFLFFTLRKIDLTKFIDIAIGNRVETILKHVNEKSAHIMGNAATHDVFGL